MKMSDVALCRWRWRGEAPSSPLSRSRSPDGLGAGAGAGVAPGVGEVGGRSAMSVGAEERGAHVLRRAVGRSPCTQTASLLLAAFACLDALVCVARQYLPRQAYTRRADYQRAFSYPSTPCFTFEYDRPSTIVHRY
jgi:hypothetical protein